jgi:putative membrane protein
VAETVLLPIVEELAMDDPVATQSKQIRKESADVRRSAKAVERSTSELTDSADRRTVLAGDRTLLAAERTYAAWVRTALAALAAGIGARALVKDILPAWIGKTTGTVLILFAGFCLIAAVWRELQGVPPTPHPDIKPIPRVLLVPMNFLLLLVAIAALVGIWSA